MTLKEIETILRGSTKFELQSKDKDGNVVILDNAFIYELKYLPASLLRRNVLRLDLDECIIFLDRDYYMEDFE